MKIFERISKLSEIIHFITEGDPNEITNLPSIKIRDVLYDNGFIDVIKGRISLIRIPAPDNNYLGVSLTTFPNKRYDFPKSPLFITFHTERPKKPENKINLYTISMVDEMYSLLKNILNLKYTGWRNFFMKHFKSKGKLSKLKLRFHVPSPEEVFSLKDIIEDKIEWNKISVNLQELDSINFKEITVEEVLKRAGLENMTCEEIEKELNKYLREFESESFVLFKTKNLYFTLSVIKHGDYKFGIATDNPANFLQFENFKYIKILINLIKVFRYLLDKYPIVKNTLMIHLFEY
jgi:hypothetical protein